MEVWVGEWKSGREKVVKESEVQIVAGDYEYPQHMQKFHETPHRNFEIADLFRKAERLEKSFGSSYRCCGSMVEVFVRGVACLLCSM